MRGTQTLVGLGPQRRDDVDIGRSRQSQAVRQPPAERGTQEADADRAADRSQEDDGPGRRPR